MILAKECVAQGCGVHTFLLSYKEVGGAWPGHIPYLTGGAMHTYGLLQVMLQDSFFFVCSFFFRENCGRQASPLSTTL